MPLVKRPVEPIENNTAEKMLGWVVGLSLGIWVCMIIMGMVI